MFKNNFIKKVAIFICILSMFTNIASAQIGFSPVEEVNSSIISLPENGVKGQVSVGVKGNSVNVVLGSSTAINIPITVDTRVDIATGLNLPIGKYLIFYEITATSSTNDRNTPYLEGAAYQYKSTATNYNTTIGRKLWKATTTEVKTKLSWWGANNNSSVDAKNFMIIPVDDTTYSLSNTELLNMYHFMTTGVKSTLCALRLKSHGTNYLKNIVDWGNARIDGATPTANDKLLDEKVRIKPNTNYTFSMKDNSSSTYRVRVRCFDEAGNTIYGMTGDGVDTSNNGVDFREIGTRTGTVSFNSNVHSIKVNMYADNGVDEPQLEEGSSATSFIEHTPSISYYYAEDGSGNVIEKHSLPNGTYDEVSDGKIYKRTEKYVLQASDIEDMFIGLANVDIARVPWSKLANVKIPTAAYSQNNQYDVHGKSPTSIADDVNSIGKWYASTTHLTFVFTKGTTLEDARNQLTGLTLTYQLATEQITNIPTTPLIAYPKGTIIIEPAVREGGVYDGSIAINNPDLPIQAIESVKRINSDSTRTVIDLSNITIAAHGKSFTITGAADGESYEYQYTYPKELTTIPTISYSVPIDQNGQISGNTNMIQQNADLINMILQEIQLLRDEINTMH